MFCEYALLYALFVEIFFEKVESYLFIFYSLGYKCQNSLSIVKKAAINDRFSLERENISFKMQPNAFKFRARILTKRE